MADLQSAALATWLRRPSGEGNLAFGRKMSASSEESGRHNLARHAVDGDLRTRWCASNGENGNTWQVELEKPAHVQAAAA